MKRIFCLLLSLLLLLSFATLGVSATAENPFDGAPWTLSQNEKVLQRGEKSYEAYPLYAADRLLCDSFLVFDQQELYSPVAGDVIYHYNIYVDPNNEHFAFVLSYYYEDVPDRIFADEQGKAWLDAFAKREFSAYLLRDESGCLANIPLDVARNFDIESADTRVFDVTELASADCFEVLGTDASETLAHTHGAIYKVDAAYYYINYDALDNSYFDSDGNFSYRRGSVSASRLDADTVGELTGQLAPHNPTYTYESDAAEFPALSSQSALGLFLFCSLLLGFVLPAVPLVLGLIFALSKKTSHPKRWHLVWALAALWMVAALAILLLVLL